MAKRSRRERRLETEKQRPIPGESVPALAEAFEPVARLAMPTGPKGAEAVTTNNKKSVINFAQEYFYVYSELKTILVVTMLMFVVMIGLSFAF
jgi:hypothetical protein